MKYKCIKSDPLGWIETGKVYELRRMGNNYYVEGEGFAVSEDNMKEMFEKVTNDNQGTDREASVDADAED